MVETGQLTSVAAISVTLAGFSALITILATRTRRSDPKVDSFRLLVALEACLMNAAFALLPLVLLGFGVSTGVAWRVSAAAYFVIDAALSLLIVRRSRALKIPVLSMPWISRVHAPASALGQLLLACAVAIPQHSFSLYFAALLLNLVISGLAFMNIAWNAFVPDPKTDAI